MKVTIRMLNWKVRNPEGELIAAFFDLRDALLFLFKVCESGSVLYWQRHEITTIVRRSQLSDTPINLDGIMRAVERRKLNRIWGHDNEEN